MTRNRHHFRLELLAHAAWHRGEQCPDSDMLAAFALRLLRGRPRRRVAAHLRTCVVCRTDARLSRPPGTIPQRGALSALLRAGSRPSPERDSRTMRPSIDEHGACREFAAALASAHDPASLLPAVFVYPPGTLLRALHRVVNDTMLGDIPRARRAALAARAVAARFPADPLLQAQAHWTQGNAVLHVPEYAEALDHYDRALALYETARARNTAALPEPDVRVVQINRVFCLSELGRCDEALAAVQAAEAWLAEQPHEYARLVLLLNRSQLAGIMGDYRAMAALAEETFRLADVLGHDDRAAQASINLANARIFLGDYDAADAALAEAVRRATLAEEPLTIARANVCSAWVLHIRGQLFAALTTLREAEAAFADAPNEGATFLLEAAVISERLRQLPEAERSAHDAAMAFARQQMPTYSASAALLAARCALQRGDRKAAQTMLAFGREQAQHSRQAAVLAEVVTAEAELAAMPDREASPQRLLRARRAARDAAAGAVALLDEARMVQEAARARLAVAALDALCGEPARARDTYGRLSEHPLPHIRAVALAALGELLAPAEALPFLRRAAALVDEQRQALPMEELQARYSSETSPVHTRLAACYLALEQTAEAYESICRAKAGPLLDLRAGAAPVNAVLQQQIDHAKAEMHHWRRAAFDHSQRAYHAAQNGQHRRAEQEDANARAATAAANRCEVTLSDTLRTLGDRGGRARVPSAAEVQAQFTGGRALLEFVRSGSDLVGFAIVDGRLLGARRLCEYAVLPALLDRWTLTYHRFAAQPDERAFEPMRSALAPVRELLIDPWRAELAGAHALVIAPHDLLHHVPWAALPEQTGTLGERWTLTLTPSGALCATPPSTAASSLTPPRVLGYAGEGAAPLTQLEAELAAIARAYPAADVNLAATAADLRAQPAPSLLHIAAHGRTNQHAPLCSALELADGPFLLLEAHRLDLRGTRLVTLSACETSVRPESGDMPLALAGAFLCAGAHMVVASLWPVPDTTTATLMKAFYAAMSAGAPAAAALQQAQQTVRQHDPLNWCAFQLWRGAASE
jgi:hypothetical protein